MEKKKVTPEDARKRLTAIITTLEGLMLILGTFPNPRIKVVIGAIRIALQFLKTALQRYDKLD